MRKTIIIENTSLGNSQNFLRQICNIFVTLRCFYKAIIHSKEVVYVFTVVHINFYLYLLQKLPLVILTSIF